MPDTPRVPNRRSIRLPAYDYRSPGAYFVTICTHERKMLLDSEPVRTIVSNAWHALPNHYSHVRLDAFIIMPNHIHGIIMLIDDAGVPVGAGSPRPRGGTGAGTAPLPSNAPPLGQIVAYFKYETTKLINSARGTPGARLWQRNYYEHVVRNEAALNRMRQYILDNPLRWAYDRDNPEGQPDKEETAFWEALGL